MYNSTDAQNSYGNIRDIVNEANGGNADASAWVGRRRNAEPTRKNPVEKEGARTPNKFPEGNAADGKRDNKSEKTKKPKKTTQTQVKVERYNSPVIAPTDTGTLPDWNEFLNRLSERMSMKDKGLKRAVLMPDYIINSLQAGFGRHSSDVLCILAEWFVAANRKNILRYISDRSGIL